jgi:ferredoxin-nitrate reductase
VGSENIKKKIEGGCSDFKELCSATGAGTGCGSCKPEVKRILVESLKELSLI